jgi:hypothetical protein
MLLRRKKALKNIPRQNMFLHIGDNPLKSLSLFAITVGWVITSDPSAHMYLFRGLKWRRSCQSKILLGPDLLGSIRLRGNYQGMLHQCTKLQYVTNVELIVMSDPRVLSLKRTHLESLDLMQDILLQGISGNNRGLFQ